MSTVAEIGDAIHKLPPNEAWQLAAELRDHLDALWDKQFEEDVTAGRLDELIGRARVRPLIGGEVFLQRGGNFRGGMGKGFRRREALAAAGRQPTNQTQRTRSL